MEINKFEMQYRFLSNFFPSDVWLDGYCYPTIEHAYQSAKSFDFEYKKEIRNLPYHKAGKAKKLGADLKLKGKLRVDWYEVNLSIMEDLLRQKFNHEAFKKLLLSTGRSELIEGNTWNDTFWGVCKGIGKNNLGKLLMKIRKDLQKNNV